MTQDTIEAEDTAPAEESGKPRSSLKKRVILVGGAALLLTAIGIGYSVYAVNRPVDSAFAKAEVTPATDPGFYLRNADGYVVRQRGTGNVAVESVAETDRSGTGLDCFRFYVAAGTAVCTVPKSGLAQSTTVKILDSSLHQIEELNAPGVPSRARVSPTGRMVSWTVFVTGDDYASSNFSTRTGIYDTQNGYLVDTIEGLKLVIDGKRVRNSDVNYWGVTFADDDNTFYATVSTGGKTYLVKGDFENWSATALRENVECPSLSPDGTRLVFKKRVNAGVDDPWRLYVLDLATMEEEPLAEDRNVDDQAAWLDDDTVAYAVGKDVWSVPADGSGEPKLIAPDASSPAMIG